MRQRIASPFCIWLFVSAATLAQQASTPPAASQSADRLQIERVLKGYTDAYDSQDLAALLKVFPDLENQKKELRKTKERFDNPRISKTQLKLEIQDVQLTRDGVVVKCKRTEKYNEVQYSSYESGDATIGGTPVQRPGPKKR